ncbi:hypothetical protein ACVWYG_002570 [Pedobacter sp. UYEF25]
MINKPSTFNLQPSSSKRNYAQLFAICKKHGLDYKDKVFEFTDGRTDSLKALTDGEYRELMIRMQLLNPSHPPNPQRGNGLAFTPKPGDKQRKSFIGIASQMRWGKDTKELIAAIDVWCLAQKYKKPLNSLDVKELNTLLYIFETKVLADYYLKLNG